MMFEIFGIEQPCKDYDNATKEEDKKENEKKYLLLLLKLVTADKIPLIEAASIADMSIDEFKKASVNFSNPNYYNHSSGCKSVKYLMIAVFL